MLTQQVATLGVTEGGEARRKVRMRMRRRKGGRVVHRGRCEERCMIVSRSSKDMAVVVVL